ncbi:uncharacterized protein KY384_003057 [Bacidia gigantensis]|uniref:uncharacterized protein n=1 Tax=Bacidia gigantensis TaxID=2732470 RepID=UPI001D05BDBC|nr:uncharacterized protein KY384_003057 [Bacidia gigantensis]KAG8531428.1 hypothetical protein KY384_003057 [Bacidia gigantensis]
MDEVGLQQEWPQRLLYVPSMISLEREEGNKYGQYIEPAYSILSYTWGRWELPEGNAALKVGGINWRVPTIDERHFSVAQLEKAIWRISSGRDSENSSQLIHFVWIDIACIDQENEALKATEIGRQAAIFKNATHAYIWLSHLDDNEMQQCDTTLFDTNMILSPHFEGNGTEPEDLESWNASFREVSETLYRDPWFTSLWTLQEMFLRPDAEILTQDANLIERKGGNGSTLGLSNLIINYTTVYKALCDSSSSNELSSPKENSELLELVEKLGLYWGQWENPMLLLIAARYRQTRNPKDRIYGIMQVYDLKLGVSSQPDRDFTVEDLQFQLASAHNAQSAINAQMFIHTQAVQLGRCWRMQSESRIPHDLEFTELGRKSLCKISIEETRLPIYQGKACSLSTLSELWQSGSSGSDVASRHSEDKYSEEMLQDVLLDLPERVELEAWAGLNNHSMELSRKTELVRLLVMSASHNIQVLLLGKLIDGIDEDIDMLAGLMVRRRFLGTVECWQRIGICLWAEQSELSQEEVVPHWRPFMGHLG